MSPSRKLRSAILIVLGALSISAYAAEEATKKVAVPAGPLTSALKALAHQSGVEFFYSTDQLDGLKTEGVQGEYTAEKAVLKLLEGTELKLTRHESGALVITLPPSSATSSRVDVERLRLAHAETRPGLQLPSPTVGEGRGEGFSDQKTAENSKESSEKRVMLEEIIVTAQKRSERLQDVPVPVTVLDAQSLISRGTVSIQDYYTNVPGLNLTIGAGGQDAPVLSIRGVTTGGSGFGGNPTVSVVVDDLPYGSSSSLGGGNLMPDLDPSDLARIEVLRGPQGTLYGASSIGGLLKYVTVDPALDDLTARFQAGINHVTHSGSAGYNLRGAINLPMSSNVAVRASGFYRSDAGYIDDPGLGVEGVNEGKAQGGRITALVRLSDATSLKLGAVAQFSDTDGQSAVHLPPELDDLQQSYVLGGLGGYSRNSYIYSAIFNASIGTTDLISVTGYAINEVENSLDRTAAFGGFMSTGAAKFAEEFTTKKFSEELRLSFPLTGNIDGRVGAFFTDESSDFVQDIAEVNPSSGSTVNLPYHNPFESSYSEYAAFADFTARLSERFDVQVGGRLSRNEQALSAVFEGALIPIFVGQPSGYAYPEETSEDTSFTYLLTPRLKLTPDLMVYARMASGYRPGGPNANAGSLGVPSSFEPDKTQNYEIGAKGTALNDALSFDVSLYYIDWQDIQLQLSDPVTSFVYFGNAGGAASEGLEVSTTLRLWSGAQAEGWAAWNNAELSDDLPPGPAFGVSGDRLPFSSRFSSSLSFDQEFAFFANTAASVGATVSYVGKRLGTFTDNSLRQEFPSYTQVDLRAGVNAGAWSIELFAKNLTDRRALLAGGLGTSQPFAFKIIQPRTIGLNLAKQF